MTASLPARSPIADVGQRVLDVVDEFGRFALLCAYALGCTFRRGFPAREVLVQFESIAARSTSIVSITAFFTGMVLALQTVHALGRFGAKPYTGSFVGLAFVLELGPVLTALVVSGRVGAGISAELGSMAVTEQVDAIRAMGADPVQKLVLPRMLAATFGVPMLSMLAIVLGVAGGALIAGQYGIGLNFYYQSVIKVVELQNLLDGLAKTFVFGWMIAMIGCHMGLRTTGGTVGVGISTTRAVVVSSIAVLVSDFFLSQLQLIF